VCGGIFLGEDRELEIDDRGLKAGYDRHHIFLSGAAKRHIHTKIEVPARRYHKARLFFNHATEVDPLIS